VRVEGDREFAAPREAVWHVLNDPASMAKTMPGVEGFEIQDERRWRANVKIPLGLGSLRMSVDMEKIEEREPEFARLAIKGNGVGAIMSMSTAFELSEGGTGTKMHWEADVRIAGPVGSMGQRVLQPIVNQQVQHVLTALEKQVQEAAAGGAATSEASDLDDYGPPAESTPEPEPPAGTSGADEGVSPLAPETYEPEPEGPTTSTEDSPER
jgi:carbon monoxide dehydrogenase subunit G